MCTTENLPACVLIGISVPEFARRYNPAGHRIGSAANGFEPGGGIAGLQRADRSVKDISLRGGGVMVLRHHTSGAQPGRPMRRER